MLNHANLVLLVQLQGWFPSMHTHHPWVLLEKFLSSNFWVIGKPGLLHHLLLVVTNDQIRPPNKVQNMRNKQTYDTYAFSIDIVPLVLEKTCFAGHTFEYKWKTKKKAQNRKRKVEMPE